MGWKGTSALRLTFCHLTKSLCPSLSRFPLCDGKLLLGNFGGILTLKKKTNPKPKVKNNTCVFLVVFSSRLPHLCKMKNNQLGVKLSFVGRISPFTKLQSLLFVNKTPSCLPLVPRLNRACCKWLSSPRTIRKAI